MIISKKGFSEVIKVRLLLIQPHAKQQTLHPLTFRNGIIVKTMILPSEACPPSSLFDAPLFFETVKSGLVRVDGDEASEEIHERLIVGVGGRR